ncbi:putative HAD superfamily hydrolase [Paenibacillus cellulosilyticus]|uniref:Putative HAD superfamily hydrolase n=1 Tax=Paenibacillus cellulosilyticus TaxID=375489 RepID=A0A2V2YZV8_9BACL|nr:hypothetical protein [Paenibacillus cellulosilyticus]PWW08334.1 putative HAD superfamily hydrolase [Paenibacillus cellulosilyticus]
MVDEKQYIINAFQTHFGAFINRRLAIYGIGPNTRHIVEHFTNFDIVGLMDEARAGETIYGKLVLTVDEVAEMNVDAIVIVARSNNVRIIYRRIAEMCAANCIYVYDVNGNLLGNANDETRALDSYNEITEQRLREKIAHADVVSFDVFDTLVMRRTLYPQDIFEIVEDRIRVTGKWDGEFTKLRIKAERELYNEGPNPKIDVIYDRIQQWLGFSNDIKRELQQLEIQVEAEHLVRREKMCEIFRFSVAQGKEVFLVSDMYLPVIILEPLLAELGIRVQSGHLLVSCDFGVTKSNGLYSILRERFAGRTIVHIGDNIEADIHAAKSYGIEDTFHVQSALNMLEDSYANELLKYDATLNNRLMIGEFTSCQLNDPFLFAATKGKFRVGSPYEMTYSFVAPVVYRFFSWMIAKAKELKLERILLGARDGYIMERISQQVRKTIPDLPQTQYLYISRATAVLAGIHTDEDIVFAASLAYSGSMEDMLRSRFRLMPVEIQRRENEGDAAYVLKHRDAILREADIARKYYLQYWKTLGIPTGARVGFFDFVSSGTCQKALSNIVDCELQGLYFARIQSGGGYKADIKIETLFEVRNIYESSWNLLDDYFFMENILTSFEPSLQAFDEAGRPVFATEHRTTEQLEYLQESQQALLDYFRETKLDMRQALNVSLEVPDLLIRSLRECYTVREMDYFEHESLVDEFTNRYFELQKH